MRRMKRDLQPVYIFQKGDVDSDYTNAEPVDVYSNYIDPEPVDVYTHTVMCSVHPASGKIVVEAYGERAYNMYLLYCDKSDKVEGSVSLTDKTKPTHKIVSIMEYRTHKTILVEVMA